MLSCGVAKGLPYPISARCNDMSLYTAHIPNYSEPLTSDERAIRALHRAIIAQAVSDLGSSSKKKEALKAKEEAEAWLGSAAFIDCCLNAGWTPENVERNIKFAELRGYAWRLPAGEGWRAKKRLMDEGVLP